MKKLFISVLAIAGLVACTQEQTLVQQGPASLEFGGAFVENATRANSAVDPSTTTASLTGFDVWGFMDSPEGVVFVDEDVTGEQGNFTYVNTQYWVPGHDYYFAALAPMNSDNWNLNTDAANTYGAGIVDFHNVDGTEDLLYAATTVSTHDIELGEAPVEKVKFQFSHLLSKVKFSFTNGFDNNNAYIDVKNVKMEVPAFASINLAQADWWSTNQWVLVEGQTSTLSFGDACAKTAPGVKQETDNERLTIPAGAQQTYKITFDVALYFGDVKAFEKVGYETLVEGVALEMGKSYNFKAELNASNITGSGDDAIELLPIVFDVEEVNEWVDAGEQTGIIAGAVKDMTLFTDVEATERVVVSGTLDGAGHTVSAVAGVNYVISNTARLIEAQAGSTIQNIKIDGKNNVYDGYGIRGIYTTGTGDVVVRNAEIVNCTYAINANNAGKLTVINSTLQGWNSYGSTTENHFENVKFIDGEFHNFRPYNNTVCKNCDFGANVVIDLSQMVAGATIKFEGCTYNGQPLSPAHLSDAAGKNVEIDMVVTEAPVSNGLVQNVNNVENMTIDGGNYKTTDGKGLRGIYITTGGVYNVNNVVVKNVTYAINVNTTAAVELNVANSTLEGWTSYGTSTTATFNNVSFECGTYANFKPYSSTVLTDCTFENGFQIDFTALTGVLTFKNCKYGNTVLTAENFASVVNIDGDCTGKIAF